MQWGCMDFRLLTFGDLRLVDGKGSIVPFPEKSLLSICFLLTSSSTQKARAELAEFLWGDIPLDKALANLRRDAVSASKTGRTNSESSCC